jgi:DNA-binding LacI/PurR family transcriptional regulator
MIDVANEARVSQSTVSLVLNHADGARLSAETRQRVMKAAARLGYQPVRRGGAPSPSSPTSIGFDRMAPPHLFDRRDRQLSPFDLAISAYFA